MPSSRRRLFFSIAFSREVVRRGIVIACIVGMILNLINQGELLVAFQFSKVNWLKFGVTFMVPFCVSVYSAAQIKMSLIPGNRAQQDLELECIHCNEYSAEVLKDALIPDCPHCRKMTQWKRRQSVQK